MKRQFKILLTLLLVVGLVFPSYGLEDVTGKFFSAKIEFVTFTFRYNVR